MTGSTRVFVHLGSPIGHTKAPAMLNAEMRRRGVDAVLVPLEVEASGLIPATTTLRAATNVGGLLVTMPHKATIIGLCDHVGSEAKFVGATNAVRFDGGRAASCEMFDGLGLVGTLGLAGVKPPTLTCCWSDAEEPVRRSQVRCPPADPFVDAPQPHPRDRRAPGGATPSASRRHPGRDRAADSKRLQAGDQRTASRDAP